MIVESIGERLYRIVTTAVWSDDRKSYTCGCVYHGRGDNVSVRFYRYEVGKGIVGKSLPDKELSMKLKEFGQELKRYVNELDRRELIVSSSKTTAPVHRFFHNDRERSPQRAQSTKFTD